MKKFVSIIMLFLAGCSGTSYLGEVGGIKYYSIHSSKFDGPNISALVSEDSVGHIKTESIIGGSGISNVLVPSLIDGGAAVGASAVFGKSIKPDKTNVNNNTNMNTDNASWSQNNANVTGN